MILSTHLFLSILLVLELVKVNTTKLDYTPIVFVKTTFTNLVLALSWYIHYAANEVQTLSSKNCWKFGLELLNFKWMAKIEFWKLNLK